MAELEIASKNRVAPYLMSHTAKQKPKLLGRMRRLKGQTEAVERALEADAPCGEILNLVASVRGAVNGLMVELIEDHIRQHVVDPDKEADSDRGARRQTGWDSATIRMGRCGGGVTKGRA